MKRFLHLRVLLSALLLQTALLCSAATYFTVGGIRYEEVNGSEVAVARSQHLSGDVVVPKTVTCQGKTYSVTAISDCAFQSSCKEMTSLDLPATIKSIGKYIFMHCDKLDNITCRSTSVPTFASEYNEGFRVLVRDPEREGYTIDKDVNIFVPASSVDAYKAAVGTYYLKFQHYYAIGTTPSIVVRFKVGDIKYVTTSETEAAVAEGQNLSGDVVVPETIAYQGKTYSVTAIADDAFGSSCNEMTSLDLPATIKSIGKYNFFNCDKLDNITCRATSVPTFASEYNEGFQVLAHDPEREGGLIEKDVNIFVPASSVEAYKAAVDFFRLEYQHYYAIGTTPSIVVRFKVGDIKYVTTSEAEAAVAEGQNLSGDVVVPKTVTYQGKTYSVTAISDCAFQSSCNEMTSLDLPATIKSIGQYNFFLCDKLDNITCRATSVPTFADEGEGFPVLVNVPEREGYLIGKDVNIFVPASSVEAYKAAVGTYYLKYQHYYAIGATPSIVGHHVKVGDITYTIKSETEAYVAGYMNSLLKGDVVVPETITYSGVTYHVTRVEDDGFFQSSQMTSLDLPATIRYVGDWAFWYCDELKTITCRAATVPSYGMYNRGFDVMVFDYREGTTDIMKDVPVTIYVPAASVEKYKAAVDKSYLAYQTYLPIEGETPSVTLPECFVAIGDGEAAFRGDGKGAYTGNFTIPATVSDGGKTYTVTAIGSGAFADCQSLTSVTIPSTVTSVAPGAFANCYGINSVRMECSVPPMAGKGVASVRMRDGGIITRSTDDDIMLFDQSTYDTATLYVPRGSKTAYMQAEGWSKFKNIEEYDVTAIRGINAADGKAAIYTTNGMRVSETRKGIYIINGRKQVMR